MKRILIVDDNPRNLELLAVLLELDYEVSEAENGASALEIARATQPALILMDLSMPVMDGWVALETLRADPTIAHIPVVAVTAHALKGDREFALEAGFRGYVTKPVVPVELFGLIDRLLGKETK